MAKKVAYLCPNGYLGGAERFVIDVCREHLSYRGEDAVDPVIIFFSHGDATLQAQNYGIEHYVLSAPIKMSHPLRLLKGVFEVRSLLKKHQVEIVHETMPYSHIVGFLSTLLMKVKLIWYQHGPVGGTLDRIASFLPVSQVLFNSQYLKGEHQRLHKTKFSVREDAVVPCGISATSVPREDIDNIRNEFGQDTTLFLMAGRLCSWKGFETGIQSFIELVSEGVLTLGEFKVLIAGDATRTEDRAYKQSLIDMVQQHKLDSHIIFLGYQERVSSFMGACDAFIHTSNIAEPFGLVVGEAMYQKSFVIGSDTGGVSDLIIHEKTGLAFGSTRENAVSELKAQIKKYLTYTNDEREVIRQAGHQKIADEFMIKKTEESLRLKYC